MSTSEITPPIETTRTIDLGARLGPEELTAAALVHLVDRNGHLNLRIEGEAASRPFVVFSLLRRAGFTRTHVWVDAEPGDEGGAVALRVTARLVSYLT